MRPMLLPICDHTAVMESHTGVRPAWMLRLISSSLGRLLSGPTITLPRATIAMKRASAGTIARRARSASQPPTVGGVGSS